MLLTFEIKTHCEDFCILLKLQVRLIYPQVFCRRHEAQLHDRQRRNPQTITDRKGIGPFPQTPISQLYRCVNTHKKRELHSRSFILLFQMQDILYSFSIKLKLFFFLITNFCSLSVTIHHKNIYTLLSHFLFQTAQQW